MSTPTSIFLVMVVSWHHGADGYPFTDREAALAAARDVAEKLRDHEEVGEIRESFPAGVLLCLSFGVGDDDDLVWVEEKQVDAVIPVPECDCAG